jgi:hypothetical protein
VTDHLTSAFFNLFPEEPQCPNGIVIRTQIRTFCLPSYSPELNPDELLNQDVKTNALGQVRPVNVQEMMDNLRSYLRITQARPKLVKRYFRERRVQYNAR